MKGKKFKEIRKELIKDNNIFRVSKRVNLIYDIGQLENIISSKIDGVNESE